MRLQDKLDAFKTDFQAGKPPYDGIPSRVHEVMRRATHELIDSNLAAKAKKAGDNAPSFALQDADGSEINSEKLLAQGPLVLSFYRGVWCPYCNIELRTLQATLPDIEKTGAQLIAISPQTAVNSRRSARENKLSFPILIDKHNDVAAAFGLRFKLPDELIALYRDTLKNDLALVNGDDSWTLPMPARFVIDQNGKILYAEVSPDYTERPEPEDLIAALTSKASC